MNAPNQSMTFVAALLTLFLGGCDMMIYDDVGPRGSYTEGDFDYAVRRGAIVTRLGGKPFAISGERFRRLMLDNISGNTRSIPADFATQASDRTVENYRVVSVFKLATGVNDGDLCQGPNAVAIAPSPGDIKLHMAFCMGDQPQSSSWGTARGIKWPDDPRLATLIRRVTYALIPAQGQDDLQDEDVIINN